MTTIADHVIASLGAGGVSRLYGLPGASRSLNFVGLEMTAVGVVNLGTEPDNPRLADVAEAAGFRHRRVKHPGEREPGAGDCTGGDPGASQGLRPLPHPNDPLRAR